MINIIKRLNNGIFLRYSLNFGFLKYQICRFL